MYSWLRRTLSMSSSSTSRISKEETQKLVSDDESYGVTDDLIEFLKTFTLETFKNFSLPDEQSNDTKTTSGGIKVDMSEWQQQHAMIVLTKVKELSQLRYVLCPRHLKEREFWRIYFALVKSYVTKYELRAIQFDKLREMAVESNKSSDTNEIEVEMTDTRQMGHLAPP